MSQKWIFTFVLIVAVGGGAFLLRRNFVAKQDDHRYQPVAARVGTIEDSVEATGEVQPLNRVEIKPPIAGRIERLTAAEGDHVSGGQILGWMSSTDRAAVLDAARAKGSAEAARWEDAYKATPILAPLAGTLILRNVVVGQTVDPSTVLFAMSDRLIVVADTDESDIGRVQLGMPAVITLDSYPNSPIQGRVFQILYEGKNVSNVITYGVKIQPKNAPPFFRSQMTANISLTSKKKENVVLVPLAAVSAASGGEKQVLMPGPKNTPVARLVQTGLENEQDVEVIRGVEPGELVLVSAKRYTPQHAASGSPLVMGGPRQGNKSSPAAGKSNGAH